ncbi:MAG: aspartate dehydrogenase [Cenarchaeum symbiont of Oopsacas minuta]|nr:aspartate dehydrogenase [Cenarchaeum symbiont of Oopsacas minuta]
MKKIGLLGCGAIGAQIAKAIDSGIISAKLVSVYDQKPERAQALVNKLLTKPRIAQNAHMLSSEDVNLVVEAASQDAVRGVALSVLQNRRDLMIMSSGALLDESVFDVLYDACAEFDRTIYLPSGAIAGIDAIKSVKSELESLSLVTTKHPASLASAPFVIESKMDIASIKKPVTVFEGMARDAVRGFPTNINVAALLAIAGLGDKTRVKIIADPFATENSHAINASGTFGTISIRVHNKPDAQNPKTSRMAVLSAIQCLKQICSSSVNLGT